MAHHCFLTIILYILHCSLLELLHVIWLPWRGCRHHCIYIFLYLIKNQHPRGLFFHIYCITHSSRYFLQSYCCLYFHLYFCPPNSLRLCDRTCHNCYILPWRTWHSCCYFSFIRCSMIEPSLLINTFPLYGPFIFYFADKKSDHMFWGLASPPWL